MLMAVLYAAKQNMSEKLTEEKVLAKYGDVKLRLTKYYKYVFTYVGIAPDGALIEAHRGGDSAGVYYINICADDEITLNQKLHFSVQMFKGGAEIYFNYDH
jgi:hypothetical protein